MDYVENQYDHYLIEQINLTIDTGNIEYINNALKKQNNYSEKIKIIADNIKLELLTESIESIKF